jgi:hypothetical protein
MFQCEPCGYFTADRCDYNRHLLTKKHTNKTSHSINDIPKYDCSVCGKVYQSRAGLWKHRTKYNCIIGKPGNPEDLETENAQMETENTADVISVLKAQIELQRAQNEQQQSQLKQMFELLSKAINTNTNVTMTNSNNNNNNNITNNVNVFLEQRKGTAMDWREFVDGLEVPMEITMSPDEKFASVFIYNLCTLNKDEIPIYCKDKKRMKFVVMVNNKWEPGDEKNIDSAFNKIQSKHVLNAKEWENDNENWSLDGKKSDMYMNAMNKVMGGATDEEVKKNKHNSINILSDAINIKDAMLEA